MIFAQNFQVHPLQTHLWKLNYFNISTRSSPITTSTGDKFNVLCTSPFLPIGVLENARNCFKFGPVLFVYWRYVRNHANAISQKTVFMPSICFFNDDGSLSCCVVRCAGVFMFAYLLYLLFCGPSLLYLLFLWTFIIIFAFSWTFILQNKSLKIFNFQIFAIAPVVAIFPRKILIRLYFRKFWVSLLNFPYTSVHTPNQRHLYGPLFPANTYSLRLHLNNKKKLEIIFTHFLHLLVTKSRI